MSCKKTNETTLTHLTKRFVKLLNSNSDRVINLNEASARLSVAKRRIYDITNVLEGIGLLQKTSKNVTRWIDCPRDSPFAAPPSNNTTTTNDLLDTKQVAGINLDGPHDAELMDLIKTYQALDEGLKDLTANIRQQLSVEGAYITYQDIRSFFPDQIVIAVKGSPDTKLEVNENLQIWMKSETIPIEVYLCPHNIPPSNNSTSQQPNGYQLNTSPHLQQSQLSNSSNTQLQETPITNTSSGLTQSYTAVSSDEGRGRSSEGQYYDQTSGISNDDNYYTNDPTLSSALSGTVSEDDDPFKGQPLIPFEAREETHYNFMLDENYTITSLFPEDNLGLY